MKLNCGKKQRQLSRKCKCNGSLHLQLLCINVLRMRKGRKKERGNSNPMERRARVELGVQWGMQEKGGGEGGKRGSEGLNQDL